MVAARPQGAANRRARRPIVDAEVHCLVEGEQTLVPYLPQRWRRHLELFGARIPTGGGPAVPSARAEGGRPDGAVSELARLREELLEGRGVELGVLIPLSGAGRSNNLELDAALARAVNDWQIAEWLEPEPRLRGSVVVPYEDAGLAVEEIERRAPDRRFVQVQLTGNLRSPMGDRRYWPIYQAAERHGLPVCAHAFGGSGYPTTGAGWPSFGIEERIAPAQAMQANVVSLVFNGVFERFPGLRVVSAGCGFGWAPPLLWRLDGCWKLLKDEVPELKRLPSEYVREQLYLSVQSLEPPLFAGELRRTVAHLEADDRLLYGSDYPWRDAEWPEHGLALDPGIEEKILHGNARALYASRL